MELLRTSYNVANYTTHRVWTYMPLMHATKLKIGSTQLNNGMSYANISKPFQFDVLKNYKQEEYLQSSNIGRTLVSNKLVDDSGVVGASPVGAAPTASSFST